MTKFDTAPDGGAAETAPDGGAAETAQDAGATGTTDTDSGATGTADGGATAAAEDSDVATGDTAGTDGGDEMDDPLVAEGEIAGDYLEELLDLLADIFRCCVPDIGNACCKSYILTSQWVISIDCNFAVVDIGDDKMQDLALVILGIPFSTDKMQLFGRVIKFIEVDQVRIMIPKRFRGCQKYVDLFSFAQTLQGSFDLWKQWTATDAMHIANR